MTRSQVGSSAPRRVVHMAVLGIGVISAMLLWTRLKIVTDSPRTAYADPKQTMGPQPRSERSQLSSDLQGDADQAVAPHFRPSQSSGPRTD